MDGTTITGEDPPKRREKTMTQRGRLLTTLVLFVATLGMAGSTDWPHWRGPNHDGKSPDKGLLKQWPDGGPPLLWKVTDIGKGFSGVAVADGTVYITGDRDGQLMLFALTLDGKPRWKTAIDKAWTRSHPGARATPTIDDRNIYLLSGNGVLGCYDAKTGKRKWKRHAKEFGGKSGGWGYAESPLVYKTLLVFKPGGGKCIAALNKSTGKTLWTSSGFSAGPEYSSCLPVVFKSAHMIVTGTRAGIVGVNAKNGRKLFLNGWSANNTANCPTPAFADDHIFWSNGYGKGGVCLKLGAQGSTLTFKEAWTTRDLVCHHGGYVIHEGHIYGNHEGGWTCLELATGRVKWRERGVGKGSLCWADGMLYLFGESGGKVGLATCSPDGMAMRGTFNVTGSGPSWAHPVVIGGRLYIRYDTNLYVFDVKKR